MKNWFQKHSIALTLIPVLLVMAMIFGFSAQTGEESGGLSEKAALWLTAIFLPGQQAAPQWLMFAIRKLGHLTEFAALGFFLRLHICQIGKRARISKQWLWTWLIATAYAATDELHQMTVAGRGPSVADVGIDSVGVVLGIVVFTVCTVILRRKAK